YWKARGFAFAEFIRLADFFGNSAAASWASCRLRNKVGGGCCSRYWRLFSVWCCRCAAIIWIHSIRIALTHWDSSLRVGNNEWKTSKPLEHCSELLPSQDGAQRRTDRNFPGKHGKVQPLLPDVPASHLYLR